MEDRVGVYTERAQNTIKELKARLEAERMHECTFAPQLDLIHSGSASPAAPASGGDGATSAPGATASQSGPRQRRRRRRRSHKEYLRDVEKHEQDRKAHRLTLRNTLERNQYFTFAPEISEHAHSIDRGRGTVFDRLYAGTGSVGAWRATPS